MNLSTTLLNIEIDLSMFCDVAEKNDHVLIKGA